MQGVKGPSLGRDDMVFYGVSNPKKLKKMSFRPSGENFIALQSGYVGR
jgi:hypothetical protein